MESRNTFVRPPNRPVPSHCQVILLTALKHNICLLYLHNNKYFQMRLNLLNKLNNIFLSSVLIGIHLIPFSLDLNYL